MAFRARDSKLPAPFLKKVLVIKEKFPAKPVYPFDQNWLKDGAFELAFTHPVTIVVGENGSGKSTLIEAIAAMCGYDQAGGGKGYRPVDHSDAVEVNGSSLGDALRGQWLPKITNGWFFKAESFFSVARYLDSAAKDVFAAPPDFLSHSHGEGFVRFFEERFRRQGIYFMDEPESALSPRRQIELLRLLNEINQSASAQVIMATHSPLLMALPGAQLLEMNPRGIAPIDFEDTDHFKLYRNFVSDPKKFVRKHLDGSKQVPGI